MPALPPERPGCPKAPGGHRPLPDPAAVRLCLVPDPAPPYDDEVPAGEPAGGGWGAPGNARPADVSRRADWDRPADGDRPADRGGRSGWDRPADRGGRSGWDRPAERGGRSGWDRPADAAPRGSRPTAGAPATPATRRPATGGPGTAGSGAGAADGWQSRFAQVLAETLAGSRPPRQIVPWTTQQAREHIQRLGPRMASVQRPRVRRVVTFRPASDVMEMAVVVGFGPRVRALAVRLERSAASAPAGLGEPAGPGGPVSRGRPAGRGGLAGRNGFAGCDELDGRSALDGRSELDGRGEPAGRWVCTAVEAA
jgi:hypothetical protein